MYRSSHAPPASAYLAMRDSPKSGALCGGLFVAKEARIHGGEADHRETPLPPPGGLLASFGDVPVGDGRDESGIDISAARNKAIREAACRRHVAALMREAATIRNGTHPEYLRRMAIAVKATKKRAVDADMDSARKTEIINKIWKHTQVLEDEDECAAIKKAEHQRLQQAEAQRLRDMITRPETGNEARRTTRATGKLLVVDAHMLHELPKATTRVKAPNVKVALLLKKDQAKADIAMLKAEEEEGEITSDTKQLSATDSETDSVMAETGDTETAVEGEVISATRSLTSSAKGGNSRDGVTICGGSPVRVCSSGGTRAKLRPMVSRAGVRNGGRSDDCFSLLSGGGGSVAPARGKEGKRGRSGNSLVRLCEDGGYVDGSDYDGCDDINADGAGGWGGARAGSMELDELRGSGVKRSWNGGGEDGNNLAWNGARGAGGRNTRTKTR